MPNIDNLNFKVIIDDAQFNRKIEAMKATARQFNTDLTNLLNVQAVSQELVVSNRKRNQMETDNVRALERQNREKLKTKALQDKLNAQIANANKGYKTQSRILQELKGYAMGYLSLYGASRLISSLVRVTGEFELQKTTLAAMLGELNEAEKIIERIKGLAVESPFQFKDLTKYAKQLSAFSVPAQELFDTTKMLADLSAGLGVGMDRIVLAYGQVRSAAFLRGQEVRQFTEAGIPILNELAKQFEQLEGRAVSTGEVFDRISARLVPFEMVAEVLKDMTSEGGKFYQMQQVQAETLRGKLMNLKDAYEIMLNEIGSAHSDKLKGAVDWVRKLMQNWQTIGGQLVDIIKLFGMYKGAVAVLNISDTIAKFGGLANAIKRTAAAQALMNSALMTNPYIAVGTAVAAIVMAINRQRNSLDATTKAQRAYNERVKEFSRIENERKRAIRELVETIQDEATATVEREAALLSLQKSYPKIFEQYDIETLKLADILAIKKQIAEEDAKQRKISAMGAIGAQQGRIKALVAQGASDRHKEDAFALLKEMEKDYLAQYVLPEMVSGLKTMTDEALTKALQDAYRKSQYNARGVETFDNIPTSQDFYEDLYSAIQSEIRRRQNTTLVEGWRKKVQDELSKLGLNKGTSFGLWADETTQSTKYVEEMIKRYKELKDEIKWVSSFDKEQTERLKKNKDAIVAIAKALNIDIENLSANKSDTAETKEEKRLKRLISTLRTLQDQYEKLKDVGTSEEDIKNIFKALYPDVMEEEGEAFITDLNYLERALKLVEELTKLNPEAGKNALVNLGSDKFSELYSNLKDQQKAYKKSAKAAGEYFEMLRKWTAEDFSLNGEGIVLDVGKIASDLNESMNEIDLRAKKAKELFEQIDVDSEEEISKVKEIFVKEFGADAWEDFWNAYYSEGIYAITRLSEKQKEYEKKLAQERVNDLAEKYVKESYFVGSIELSDMSDKNYFQIKQIRKKLQNLLNEEPLQVPIAFQEELQMSGIDVNALSDVDLSELFDRMEVEGAPISKANQELLNLIQSIQKAGLSTEKFGETVKKVIGGDLKNLSEEEAKALMSMVQSYLGEMNNLLASLSDYAEAIGNDELQGAVNGLGESMQILGGIADKLAKGDWIGAIISGITSIASTILKAVSAQAELNAAIAETRNEMRLLASQNTINKNVESIFGTDEYKKFTNAYDEAVKAHKQALEDMVHQNKIMFGGTKDNWGLGATAGSLAAGAALGAAVGSVVPVIGTAIGAGVGALIGMVVGLVGNAATEANDYAKSLQSMANEIGADLIDESTGMFNVETLKNIKETYEDLDSSSKKMLDKLITNAEIYQNAITEIATYMTYIFGQCADEMANAFITSFKESGEAALEYGDIVSDVATGIAKSIVKSAILQNVFDEDDAKKAAAMLASGNAAGAIGLVQDAMESAKELTPYIQQLLESIQPYFEMGETGQSLGEGFKGITEKTAGLRASYINAIRADVSYSKTIWERMDVTTQQIASLLAGFSAPNLMEYQQQIAANTFNTANGIQTLIDRLESVIGSDGGFTGIRTIS